MEFLQKYLFIPLDIFQKSQHNKGMGGKRNAWLALFSSDDPETVIELAEKYPEFRRIYEECYEICRNIERVMEMFSKELYELDRNTVQYMIDEMQDTIDAQQDTIDAQQDTIDTQRETIGRMEEDAEKKYEQGIRNTVKILRSLHIPETEIVRQICDSYETDEERVRRYL